MVLRSTRGLSLIDADIVAIRFIPFIDSLFDAFKKIVEMLCLFVTQFEQRFDMIFGDYFAVTVRNRKIVISRKEKLIFCNPAGIRLPLDIAEETFFRHSIKDYQLNSVI